MRATRHTKVEIKTAPDSWSTVREATDLFGKMRNNMKNAGSMSQVEGFFTNRVVVFALATLCCCLWGAAYPGIKSGYELFAIAADDVPSKMVFAGYRFFIAGVVLLVISAAMGTRIFRLGVSDLKGLACLGLTQTTLQYIFFYLGLAHTTGSKGAILNGTVTFFSVILAHFLFRNERLRPWRAMGCLVGFAGVMLVNFNADMDFNFSWAGEGNVVLAAFIFAASSIYGKRLSQRMDVILMAGWQLTIGGAVLVAIGYGTGGDLGQISVPALSVLAFLIFLSSAAFSLWSVLLKYNEVGIVTIFNFLTPVSGAVLSGLVLHENIWDVKLLVSLLFVCAGIWMVTNDRSKKAPAVEETCDDCDLSVATASK